MISLLELPALQREALGGQVNSSITARNVTMKTHTNNTQQMDGATHTQGEK